MFSIREFIQKHKKNWIDREPSETQIFSFLRQNGIEKSHIHLRIDPDGNGALLINASRIVHLNASASLMARLALEDNSAEMAVKKLTRQFLVPSKQAATDYANFLASFDELICPDGACPIHDLNLPTIPPYSAAPSAPYRMDLALTYRCNNDCAHCYNARTRDFPELTTDDWKRIIDRVWQVGIPHIVFTGGEPSLRKDLLSLIAYAQEKGLITGLNTNGRMCAQREFVHRMVDAGLDHIQITIESHDSEIHDSMVRTSGAWRQTVEGIRNALNTPLYVMTNTTMLRQNAPSLDKTLLFLADLRVPTVGLNALIYAGAGAACGSGLDDSELTPLLKMARAITEAHQQRLIWYTPTQYCKFDPMDLELGIKGCTAALYNMCIEPNGDVIPCQSYYQSLGSFLDDPWESIWEHDLALCLRGRHSKPDKCNACALFSECGGGCPLKQPIDN